MTPNVLSKFRETANYQIVPLPVEKKEAKAKPIEDPVGSFRVLEPVEFVETETGTIVAVKVETDGN